MLIWSWKIIRIRFCVFVTSLPNLLPLTWRKMCSSKLSPFFDELHILLKLPYQSGLLGSVIMIIRQVRLSRLKNNELLNLMIGSIKNLLNFWLGHFQDSKPFQKCEIVQSKPYSWIIEAYYFFNLIQYQRYIFLTSPWLPFICSWCDCLNLDLFITFPDHLSFDTQSMYSWIRKVLEWCSWR